MKWEKRSEYFPPGYEGDKEIWTALIWLVSSAIYSFRFFAEYKKCYTRLWDHIGHPQLNGTVVVEKIVREGKKIEPFLEILGNSMMCFYILFLLLSVFGILHYIYYYQESRSILLVRRLSDRFFVWKTCAAGPVLGLVIALTAMGMLLLVYYGTYLLVTPAQCLP